MEVAFKLLRAVDKGLQLPHQLVPTSDQENNPGWHRFTTDLERIGQVGQHHALAYQAR